MGILKAKTKTKIIRAFRAPTAPLAMSLMAVILICAAPALVAVIDDSAASQVMIKNAAFEGDGTLITYYGTEGWSTVRDLSVLMPADNDGAYFFTNTVAADATGVRQVSLHENNNGVPVFDRLVVTVLSGDMPDSVQFSINSIDEPVAYPRVTMPAEQTEPGVFVLDTSSIDRAKMSSDSYVTWSVYLLYSEGLTTGTEFTVENYGSNSIPYGEIIVGATGALLLICAALASPLFGTSGYTGPKFKRRS